MNTPTPLARVRPSAQHRYRRLPVFGRSLDDLVAWAVAKGYRTHSIYLLLDAVRHLEAWLRRRRRYHLAELTEDELSAAYHCFRARRRDPRYAWPLHCLVLYLRARGHLKPSPMPAPTPTQREVQRWLEHLRKTCGLAPSTLDSSRRHATQLLRFIHFDRDQGTLARLTLASVNAFLCHASRRVGRHTMQHVVGSVRGFLRFEFFREAIERPLHLQIDTVRVFREEQLPHPVRWAHLQHLLGRIDRSTSLGRRDYAVLLVAATYGLRASDVANLTLDAIDWRARAIRIVQCKTRQPLTLPLTDQVGAALVDYIRHARPATSLRQVFLRHTAPIAPLSLPGMANTLRRASSTAGVVLPAAGFRCLRHALALRLLRQGISLKGIGDVLGHRSPASTSHYLRMDVDDLRRVALPVPAAVALEPPLPSADPPASSARGPGRKGAMAAPPGWHWRSCIAEEMQDYLKLQRAMGRVYKMPERTLRGLDFFLVSRYPSARRLNGKIFTAWASGLQSLSPTTARMRMLCVRKLSLHLSHARPTTFVPDAVEFPKELPHLTPCILTASDVARVLAATAILRRTRTNPLHPWTYRIGFSLLYCCGLRLGEALKLRLEDIDCQRMVLRINESKFNKSRLVPLSPSFAHELRRYLRARQRAKMPLDPSSPLLWNGYSSRRDALTPSPVWATWVRLCRHAGVLDPRGKPPRPHDLRHSFAVEALRRGYRAGREPQAVLPRLARYMGHASAQFTHYYLKFTEPLRRAAGDRFHRHLAAVVLSSQDEHAHGERHVRNGGGR